MAGLPPVPADVAHLEQDVFIDGLTVSLGWWLRNPNNLAMDGPHAEALLAAYFSTVQPSLLGLMHNECSLTTCRLTLTGFRAEGNSPPNVGAWDGATEVNVASGLKWTMQARGRSSWTMNYIPCCPSAFIDGHWRLNQTGFGTLRANGLDILNAMNALPAPIFGTQVLGTVRRKTAEGPLIVSEFVQFQDVYPVTKLVSIGRRIPKRGQVPPLP